MQKKVYFVILLVAFSGLLFPPMSFAQSMSACPQSVQLGSSTLSLFTSGTSSGDDSDLTWFICDYEDNDAPKDQSGYSTKWMTVNVREFKTKPVGFSDINFCIDSKEAHYSEGMKFTYSDSYTLIVVSTNVVTPSEIPQSLADKFTKLSNSALSCGGSQTPTQSNSASVTEQTEGIISKHKGITGLDEDGLGDSLVGKDPSFVLDVLSKLDSSDIDDVITAYLENFSKDEVNQFSADFRESLYDQGYRMGWTSSNELPQLAKLLAPELDGTSKTFTPNSVWHNENAYFVNGQINTPSDYEKSARLLAEITGRPIEGIYNLSHGVASDTMESAKGKAQDGGCASPACLTLVQKLKDDLANNKPIDIYAHSQGSIITSNALYAILEENPNAFADADVKIHTYGGAAFSFPNSVDVDHNKHTWDPISFLGGAYHSTTTSVSTTKDQHDFNVYMEDFPKFVVERNSSYFGTIYEKKIAGELYKYPPKTVRQTLLEIDSAQRPQVVAELASFYSTSVYEKLPKSNLYLMKENLEANPSLTDLQKFALDKIKMALGE